MTKESLLPFMNLKSWKKEEYVINTLVPGDVILVCQTLLWVLGIRQGNLTEMLVKYSRVKEEYLSRNVYIEDGNTA